MKKRFVALACMALLAVACSSDSSSNTAGPDGSTESVNSSSDATPASSSESVESDEDSTSTKIYVREAYDDEENVEEKEEDGLVTADEPESSSSSSKKRSSSSKARSKSSSSAVVVLASSSSKTRSSSSAAVSPASSSSAKSSSSAAAESGDWRQTCLDVINEYRATENLGPLSLAPEEKQTCTDKQAADDLAAGKGHANFGACDELAQNSGPNVGMRYYKSYDEIAKTYLKMMWEDEKALVTSGERDPDNNDDYPYIGHYLNMKGSYKTVSCGIAVSDDGKTGWLNIDFYTR
jgi:hypothetical protein